MWPWLRFIERPWACAWAAGLAGIALFAMTLSNPVDDILADVAGVFQGEDGNVVIDVAGDAERITVGGRVFPVRVQRLDDDGVVFHVVGGGGKPIAVRKHWSEDHERRTLDLFDGDDAVAGGLVPSSLSDHSERVWMDRRWGRPWA